MESAPLTRGHAHARSASSAARSSNSTAAVKEHQLAASEFAQAATGTADAEALRTLRLLESHHQKLHEILQFRSSHPALDKVRDASAEAEEQSEAPAVAAPPAATPPAASTPARSCSPQRSANQPPTLAPTHRSAPRDLNSSIASNLASARGIPTGQRRRGPPASPAVTSEQAGGRILASLDKKRVAEASKLRESTSQPDRPSLVVPEAPERLHRSSAQGAVLKAEDDVNTKSGARNAAAPSAQLTPAEPFQRFYATFENLISKLSAPLVFAGLPLAGDAPGSIVPEKPSAATSTADHERATAGPDLSKIFSKAALQAVKESNGPNLLGAGAESFYVVPTTGGTISYAGILSKAEQERRAQIDGGTRDGLTEAEDDEEPEFVDAREMPPTPSPEKSRHGSSRAWRFGGPPSTGPPPTLGSTKTLEELQLENQALKQLSDTLSRRLHMWEVNAQSSSMALQQSLRALQRSPVTSDAGRATAAGEETSDHTKELEEQLRAATRDLEILKKENTKLRAVVTRYREKWDKLKEGASRRRAEKKEG